MNKTQAALQEPGNIETLEQLIKYYHGILSENPEKMQSKDEQESAAAGIVGAMLMFSENEHKAEWINKYSQLDDIMGIASNLEWSNVEDVNESWAEIRRLVKEFEEEVKV